MPKNEPTNSELMNVLERIEQNHIELVDFLQENMVTKEELSYNLGQLNYSLRDYVDRKINNLRGDLVQIGVLKRI